MKSYVPTNHRHVDFKCTVCQSDGIMIGEEYWMNNKSVPHFQEFPEREGVSQTLRMSVRVKGSVSDIKI